MGFNDKNIDIEVLRKRIRKINNIMSVCGGLYSILIFVDVR